MLEILLQQLGFSKKEMDIYLFLLKNGALTPAEISKKTKINRSTVYVVAQELMKKGIIKEDLATATKTLIPLPPHELQNLYKRDEKELEIKRMRVNTAMSELEKIAKETKYTLPKINFVPEEEMEDYMYKIADTWDKSAMQYDNCRWGYRDNTFLERFHDWIDWYWSRADKKIKMKMLSNKSILEEKYKGKFEGRNIKYSENLEFTSGLWISGDYVSMVQTRKSPMYLLDIRDKELAKNLRELFKKMYIEE